MKQFFEDLIPLHKKLNLSSQMKYIKPGLVYGPEVSALCSFKKMKLIVAEFELYCVLNLYYNRNNVAYLGLYL